MLRSHDRAEVGLALRRGWKPRPFKAISQDTSGMGHPPIHARELAV